MAAFGRVPPSRRADDVRRAYIIQFTFGGALERVRAAERGVRAAARVGPEVARD